MRRGEACALRWHDIDPVEGIVQINESVISARGGARIKAPKTRASIRRVAVDSDSLTMLDRLRQQQIELAAATTEKWDDDAFVFSFDPSGREPPHPDAMSHAFTRIRKEAGVQADVHLHSLRHFHATALDAVISEAQKQLRLGWSTVQMARHYTDGVPAEDRRAAEHVAGLLR
jgi:integrase